MSAAEPHHPQSAVGAVGAVAVIVPARDEEDLVGACLESVSAALAASGRPGVIVLVAHRCTDRTVARAREVLAGSGLPGRSVLVDDSPTVATARRAGTALAVADLARLFPAVPAERCWLLSTDADSVVPPTWIDDVARHADQGAAAVAGLVHLHGWEATPAAREAYRAILRAGLRRTGHDHVYGANLAVRLDAYLDVGGWPDVVPGEDSALVAALRRHGRPVVGARDVWVRTSGRQLPRAEGGLGSLLQALTSGTPVVSRAFES
jgi:cellulose synthase/poly-beta-1,6-N-acetylglucosamine synthase-like glycosyltransferase